MASRYERDINAQAPLRVVEGNPQAPERTREQMLAEMEAAARHAPGDERPYYAKRNRLGFYTWRGVELRSVTTYLGYATAKHLLLHYGRQAALRAASHLVIAGLVKPDDDRLKEYCDGFTHYLSPDQALQAATQWQQNMVEAERYRDHKARIGSLAHHFVYSCAMGHLDPSEARDKEHILAWLWSEAVRLRLFERGDAVQEPSERQLEELVSSAYAYVLSAADWLTIAKPRWEMIGQEAMVVRTGATPDDPWFADYLAARFGLSPQELWKLPEPVQQHLLTTLAVRYAGTVDAHLTLHRGETGLAWHGEWPEDRISLWTDFKTSNTLDHRSVQAQISAYEDADCIVLVDTGAEFPLPKADHIGSLHIGPHAEAMGLKDEFGTLESHTKQIGAKLYTYPRSPLPLAGFLGLVQWADYADNVPRAHQQRMLRSAPKAAPIPKTQARPCPF